MQPGFAGFPFVDNVYGLSFTERLHQSNRGTSEHIMRFLEGNCTPEELSAINMYIAQLPSFPGLDLPSKGLAVTKKASATQLANVFKLLPVALLAHQKLLDKFLEPIQGKLRY